MERPTDLEQRDVYTEEQAAEFASLDKTPPAYIIANYIDELVNEIVIRI